MFVQFEGRLVWLEFDFDWENRVRVVHGEYIDDGSEVHEDCHFELESLVGIENLNMYEGQFKKGASV